MREPKPVTRVELSDKNRTIRIVAAILLLVIGAVAISSGIMSLLNQDTGWQKVQVTTQERSCSESFLLQYNFSGSGAQATAVNNKLQAVYGEASVKAYQLFTPDESIDGVQNVYYVNHHPNELVTVDPALYAAFEKLDGTPYLYLGPAYAHYYNIIFNSDETFIEKMDPYTSPEAAAYVRKIAEFAGDAEAVNLELLGNNTVMLHVGEEYLAFAEAEEIENFIDFAYMTNAFVIDYLAEALIANDLTQGYLVSTDGYTRNLDSENEFRFNIFDRVEETVYPAAVMKYRGPISMVYLKDYPMADSDANYRVNEERFIHLFADPADGIYQTSTENLVSYSYDSGCADVLLQMLPGFLGDRFTVPEDVFSVWCEEEVICYNDESISFTDLLRSEEMSYRVILKQ